MNQIVLTGNLTKDPEKVSTTSGKSLCKLVMAVNKYGKEDAPLYINVVCWNALADNCVKFLTKGSKVLVNGELNIRVYDASDGSKKYVTEVMASDVEFLNTKNN